MNRNFALLILCGAALSACSEQSSTDNAAGEPAAVPSETPSQASGATFDAAYAAATDALAEAAANRNVWSKTETLLEQSKAANSEGRTEVAIKLANEAKLQADLATNQALTEKDAWRSRILTQ
jgi:hypothetical protein